MKKEKKINPRPGKQDIFEHLEHCVKGTTPYQRMQWLGKAMNFYRAIPNKRRFSF